MYQFCLFIDFCCSLHTVAALGPEQKNRRDQIMKHSFISAGGNHAVKTGFKPFTELIFILWFF